MLMRYLLFEPGETALKRRMHAFKLLELEPERSPDLLGNGPDAPCDDEARARFYGEI